MNPLLLWVPGTALILVGVLLLVTQALAMPAALAVVAIGVAVETAGVLLWVRERAHRDARPRR